MKNIQKVPGGRLREVSTLSLHFDMSLAIGIHSAKSLEFCNFLEPSTFPKFDVLIKGHRFACFKCVFIFDMFLHCFVNGDVKNAPEAPGVKRV